MTIKFAQSGYVGSRVMAATWRGHVAHWHESQDGTWNALVYQVNKKNMIDRYEIGCWHADSREAAISFTESYVSALANAKSLGQIAHLALTRNR